MSKSYNINYILVNSETVHVETFNTMCDRDMWYKRLCESKKKQAIIIFCGRLIDTQYIVEIYKLEDEINEEVYSNGS